MADNFNFGEEFDTNGEFSLIDDGEYEVYIAKVEPKISKKGGKYLNFQFQIRSDVNQKFCGRRLFYTVSAKEGDSCYDFARINKMIVTQKDRKDYKKAFADFDEVLLYLNGLHMRLSVVTNFDDYSGKDRNEVKDFSFAPSEWDKSHADSSSVQPAQAPASEAPGAKKDITNDDDLPF